MGPPGRPEVTGALDPARLLLTVIARGLLGWSQLALAKKAGVTIEVLRDIEADRSVPAAALQRVRGVLERANVDLSRAGPRLQAR